MDRDRNLQAQLLLSAISTLKVSSYAFQSYLREHCLQVLRFGGIKASISAKKIACQFCHIPWEYGAFTVKVLPSKRKGKKIRKIMRRKEKGKKLSKLQEKLISSIKSENTVVLHCQICHKLTSFKTSKNISSEKIIPVENESSTIKNKKKKRKLKKQFSGLKLKNVNQFYASEDINKEGQAGKMFNNVEHSNSLNANKRKKKDIGSVSDISAHSTKKIARLEKTEDFEKKDMQNSLSTSNKNDQSSISLCKNTFVPLEVNVKKPKEDVKLKNTKQTGKNQFNLSKKHEVIKNPVISKSSKVFPKKCRKLNQLKNLISEEEKKVSLGPSLKDFLNML